MILGAVVDLGLSMEGLREGLSSLELPGYHLESHRVRRCGLDATKVDVVLDAAHPHHHEAHRGLGEILSLLDKSRLDSRVKQRSAEMFRRLAEVEGAMHGVRPEEVHFHEVGAVDSIVDVVGSVLALEWLHADRFSASPLNVGTGSVSMSHGTFPVPPPATAALVRGIPVYGEGEGELLTPTGALLITGFATRYGPLPRFRPEGVGHGAGSRDLAGRPNVLRVFVGREEGEGADETIVVLEAQVDDTTGQFLGELMDRLLEGGALDVFLSPIQMKKGRPGTLITVLVEPERREAAEEILFKTTTTLGIRRQEWQRTLLDRTLVPVETPFGSIRVKVGSRAGQVLNVQPEFEDCRTVAKARGVELKEVWAAALAAAERLRR